MIDSVTEKLENYREDVNNEIQHWYDIDIRIRSLLFWSRYRQKLQMQCRYSEDLM